MDTVYACLNTTLTEAVYIIKLTSGSVTAAHVHTRTWWLVV